MPSSRIAGICRLAEIGDTFYLVLVSGKWIFPISVISGNGNICCCSKRNFHETVFGKFEKSTSRWMPLTSSSYIEGEEHISCARSSEIGAMHLLSMIKQHAVNMSCLFSSFRSCSFWQERKRESKLLHTFSSLAPVYLTKPLFYLWWCPSCRRHHHAWRIRN